MTRQRTVRPLDNQQKDLVLKEMIDHCLAGTSDDFLKDVFQECMGREVVATTVVAIGLAFPHAKVTSTMAPVVCVG